MSDDFSQFNAAFFEESAEHMTAIESGLLELEQRPADLDLLNTIFRSAHSIKGVAGMLGFAAIAQFTHKMETLLDQMRNGRITANPPLTDLLLKATDCLKTLIDVAQTGSAADDALMQQLGVQLEAAAAGSPPNTGGAEPPLAPASAQAPASPTHRFTIRWTPPSFLFQRGLDPQQIFKELGDLGAVTDVWMDADRLPDLVGMDPEQCYLAWTLSLETDRPVQDIESVFEFVREGSELTIDDVGAQFIAPDLAMISGSGVMNHAPTDADDEDAEPKRLGDILVEDGIIPPEALAHALAQQKRVGEILIEQHAATPQQVAQALEKQRQGEATAHAKKGDTASIRVDTAKIDKLINLVGELVITQSMLSDLGSRFTMSQLPLLLERLTQLEHNTRELQERVMGIRMLQIGTVFSRFPRLVRDLAGKNGKKMQLVISGEETELDKTVIESIGDPLTHLIRNSADHGLESPEDRLAAGKPEQGTIRLNAYHEGGNICITVADDGWGLNRDKILAKAVKQGLIQEGEKLPDDQTWALIFQPGFSTADKVTDVSGRGVGMDVVKRNIEALGGTVSIKTALGKGTTFTLKLPLTLAIIEGMTVRVGKELYIIPLVSIVESIQPQTSTLTTIAGKAEMMSVRGACHPVLRLYQIFNIQPEYTDMTKGILVILETEGERVAVMVDELVGQQQVVIKSLDRNFRKVEGVAGATILGDGTVGLILDVRGLLELARQEEPAELVPA
jgi:two-component system chemotaxis sensor kinase CheA